MNLIDRIRDRTAVIGILGLGYVGLPLADAFIRKGFTVIGLDTDDSKVRTLKQGKTYIKHIPDDKITGFLKAGFTPTSDFSMVAKCDAVLVCVPTPLNQNLEPDMTFVIGSCRDIAANMRPGQMIILESTTYPGTTVEVMKPVLEEGSGLKADRDFWLAYSPEREDPNNSEYECETIPKVVGADCEYAREAAVALYGQVIRRVVPVSSTRVAEAAKILENTFRAVNIALVNELKVVFTRMGIDVWEAIDAAATKPFGFMKFTPGPGIGGHCIPIDPFYLTWKAREYEVYSRFIETAGQVNRAMPAYVVSRTMEAFSQRGRGLAGSTILIVGLAYKKNMDDARESPSYRLMDLLEQQGVTVSYHDPHIPVIPPSREYSRFMGRKSVDPATAGDFDAVLISSEHDDVDWDDLLQRARLIIDTRGVFRQPSEKVVKA